MPWVVRCVVTSEMRWGNWLKKVSMSVLGLGLGSVPQDRVRLAGLGGRGLQGGLVFSKAWMRWPIVSGQAASPTQRPVVVKTGISSWSASNTRT